jgi:molybdopterin synthase catalytic subunit
MVEITDKPLELAPLIADVRADDCGAIVAFLGVVRATADDGRVVDGLTYEAYPVMALPEMEAIAAETESKFGGAHVAIVHRVGELAVGEPSVAIVVAAPHRGVAFDACEYAIDELKTRVPIWKKEHYASGEAAWRENAGRAPS